MYSMTRCSLNFLFIFFVCILFSFSPWSVEAKLKDGKLARKLEEHHSTIKCMLNIAEDTLPELDDYVGCCGFWAIHDFLLHKVEDECDENNLKQVKGMSAFVAPKVREHCAAYPQGSFTCRLLIIMPITFAVLFVIFFVAINVCACVMFFKWRHTRTKYHDIKTGVSLKSVEVDSPKFKNKNIRSFRSKKEEAELLKGGSKAANSKI